MATPSGAATRFAYVPEVTPGTTPATPAFQTMRVTGGGLRPNKTTGVSEEIQPDRNVRDEFQLFMAASATYPFELSYGSMDALFAGAAFGTWATNVLKNGITRQYFTFEEAISALASPSFVRGPMGMVDMLSLDITAQQKITGSLAVKAQTIAVASSAISGATYTAANTKGVMTAAASFGGLSIADLSPAPKLRRLTLQIRNNLADVPYLGSMVGDEYADGDCDVTGELEALFDGIDLYQKVLDHGGGAISATIGQTANEKYTILLPNSVFLDGAHQIGGKNQKVMMRVPFRAKYDATEACSIKITRAVA